MSKVSPSYRYYNSIHTLPLRCYKDAVIRGNLAALVIEGFPPEDELQAAFFEIQEQYADTMGDVEYKSYLTLTRELTMLTVNYQQIHIAVQQLSIIIPQYLANPDDAEWMQFITAYRASLHQLIGVSFEFTDKATYENQLQRCINRSKGIKIELDMKSLQFQGMREKFEQGKQPDDSYFNSILITLSDHAGYHLTDNITVYEFADRLRRLNKEALKLKK